MGIIHGPNVINHGLRDWGAPDVALLNAKIFFTKCGSFSKGSTYEGKIDGPFSITGIVDQNRGAIKRAYSFPNTVPLCRYRRYLLLLVSLVLAAIGSKFGSIVTSSCNITSSFQSR